MKPQGNGTTVTSVASLTRATTVLVKVHFLRHLTKVHGLQMQIYIE